MTTKTNPQNTHFVFLAWILLLATGSLLQAEDSSVARFVLSHLKHKNGLALDIGCGNASLSIAIAKESNLTIHAIDPDPKVTRIARQAVDAAGIYGTRISVHADSFAPLPFPDYIANLIICGDEFSQRLRGRNFKELYRVLSPNGVAVIGQSAAVAKKGTPLTRESLEGWIKTAGIESYNIIEKNGIWAVIHRPYSPGWDQWTHRNYDPTNSLASKDMIPFTNYRPQWITDFRPGVASSAIAIADGKVIYASLSYKEAATKTPYIQVLDAFTGIELWSKVGKKEWPVNRPASLYSNREFCSDIACIDNTLYLLGGKQCHVIGLDSERIEKSFEIPPEAKAAKKAVWLYLSCTKDTLFGGVGSSPRNKVDWNSMMFRGTSKAVFALDRKSGKLRWISKVPAITASITIANDTLYFCDHSYKLHALDTKTGTERWNNVLELPPYSAIVGAAWYQDKIWVLYNKVKPKKDRKTGKITPPKHPQKVVGHNGRYLTAYSAKDGSKLFECDFGISIAGFTFSGDSVFGMRQHNPGAASADTKTGKRLWKSSMYIKCTATLATPKTLIYRSTETSILDVSSLKGAESKPNIKSFGGFRPTCTYAALPAYGMLYIQAPGCRCASPFRANITMIPGPAPKPDNDTERLLKGPAFDQEISLKTNEPIWSGWRGNSTRSGRSSAKVTLAVDGQGKSNWEQLWSAKGSGELTPLAAGNGLVFSGTDARKVYAHNSSDGKLCWQFVSEGRIKIAPYLSDGRLYFGDDLGFAYCLQAETGKLIWRFRAALGPDRVLGYGRLMSIWPVGSGLLIQDGIAYLAAGLLPNEGTKVYALDAKSGKELWSKAAVSRKKKYVLGYLPDGSMAFGNETIFVPTRSGNPWQINLKGPEHLISAAATAKKGGGRELMWDGKNMVSLAPGLQFIWHAKYFNEGDDYRLPITTDDRIFMLNYSTSKKVRELVCVKREAFVPDYNRGAAYTLKLAKRKKPAVPDYLIWKAHAKIRMTALIEVSGMLFSGGLDKIYATQAKDGKEIWSAPVPGEVVDIAFQSGRLFVLCKSGEIVCFGVATK